MVAKYGRIVIVGNRGSLEFEPRLAMIKEADILGMALVNAPKNEYEESLYAIKRFLESGVLRPQIGKMLSLEDAGKAQELIMGRNALGKIVLNIK